jgi:hypothetical protein
MPNANDTGPVLVTGACGMGDGTPYTGTGWAGYGGCGGWNHCGGYGCWGGPGGWSVTVAPRVSITVSPPPLRPLRPLPARMSPRRCRALWRECPCEYARDVDSARLVL